VTHVSISDSLLAAWGLHGSAVSDSNSLAELLLAVKLVPSIVVHPLSEKLNGWLGAINLFLWHVEIIDEDDGVLSKRWSPDALTTPVHASVNDVLSLIGRCLSREGKTKESPVFILETLIELVQD